MPDFPKKLFAKVPGLGGVLGAAGKGLAEAARTPAEAAAAEQAAPYLANGIAELSGTRRAELVADTEAFLAYLKVPNKHGGERNAKAGHALAEILVAVGWEIVD